MQTGSCEPGRDGFEAVLRSTSEQEPCVSAYGRLPTRGSKALCQTHPKRAGERLGLYLIRYNDGVTKSEVASRLTEARLRSGMTQAELAKKLGTSQPNVARAESGYQMPGVELIDRWARATKTQIPLLLGAPPPKLSSSAK